MENNYKNDALKVQCKTLIHNAEFIISKCEEADVVNEQWFLDFLDKLNKLSVKF